MLQEETFPLPLALGKQCKDYWGFLISLRHLKLIQIPGFYGSKIEEAPREAFSSLKRTYSISKNEIYLLFSIFCVIFALPDPQHWFAAVAARMAWCW
jgi:hypothetical protein